MKTLFQKGEQVLVKRLTNDRDCCYGVVPSMQEFCGQIVTIGDAYALNLGDNHYDETTGRYYVLEDPDGWMWCDNCFEKLQPDIEDVNVDVSELL